MSAKIRIGVAQVHTQATLDLTLKALRETTERAASQGISILLFPEAYLGGYPRTCGFGAVIGSRSDDGREQYLQYFKSAVDLGDTPGEGGGDDWTYRRLPVNEETGRRGDGTREILETIARETGVFVVTGAVEKAAGSLYCTALYIDPMRGVLGKRRKVMPTGSERLVWAQGQPSSLKAVSTTIKGVRIVMGCAICWENYMPLLRYSIYSQHVNLWLAPTADPRDTWESLMKTIAIEGRCYVVSANQCIKTRNLPSWVTGNESAPADEQLLLTNGNANQDSHGRERRRSMSTRTEENHEITWKCKEEAIEEEASPRQSLKETSLPIQSTQSEDFASRGGSCIINPFGKTVQGPIWEKEDELIYFDADFEDCQRGKLDFDASGHYARSDVFKLTVEGLELRPLP